MCTSKGAVKLRTALGANNKRYAVLNVAELTNRSYAITVRESSNRVIPAGSTLAVTTPNEWTEVKAPSGQTGWNAPTTVSDIDGSKTIIVTTSTSFQNTFRDFQIAAKSPEIVSNTAVLYQFYTTFTIPNAQSAALVQLVVQVTPT